MKLLVAAALAVCIAVPSVLQAEARNSAKFLSPSKAPLTQYPRGCGDYATIKAGLEKQYGEEMVWREMATKQRVTQLWQGDESWTITVSNADGVTCIVIAGETRGASF